MPVAIANSILKQVRLTYLVKLLSSGSGYCVLLTLIQLELPLQLQHIRLWRSLLQADECLEVGQQFNEAVLTFELPCTTCLTESHNYSEVL